MTMKRLHRFPREPRHERGRAPTHRRRPGAPLVEGAAPATRLKRAVRWTVGAAIVCALLILVVAAFIEFRSGQWHVSDLIARATEWSAWPFAPLVALAVFVVGGLVVAPMSLMMAASIVVFGPAAGAFYALVGSVLAAAAVHEVGRAFPDGALARLIGSRGERLRERVAQHGIVAMAVIRILPIAPYSVVSLAGGAARIPRAPFLAGTALGNLPGLLMYAFFIDRAREALANPRPMTWAMLVFALALIVAAGLVVRAYHARTQRRREAERA